MNIVRILACLVALLAASSAPVHARHAPYLGVETSWGGRDQFGSFTPHALAAGPDGSVYALMNPLSVTRFDRDGNVLTRWSGDQQGRDIAVGASGAVYVSGGSQDVVHKYSPDGAPLAVWDGTNGTPTFNDPNGITADTQGNVYVSVGPDPPGIVQVAEDGSVLARLGVQSNRYLARDAAGYFFGTRQGAVTRMRPDGAFDGFIGFAPSGPEPGHFSDLGPGGVTVAADGSVWAADSPHGRIQGFERTGALVGICGGQPNSALDYPQDIAAGGSDLFVADSQFIRRIGMGRRPTQPCDALSPTLSDINVFYRRPVRFWGRRSSLRLRSSEPVHLTCTLGKRVRRDGRWRWRRKATGRLDLATGTTQFRLRHCLPGFDGGAGNYRLRVRLADEVGNRSGARYVAIRAR